MFLIVAVIILALGYSWSESTFVGGFLMIMFNLPLVLMLTFIAVCYAVLSVYGLKKIIHSSI